MRCGGPPRRLRRLRAFLSRLRGEHGCGDFFLEEPPPDSFVREPRRPRPQAPGGSVALDLPPDCW
jgi:hypothetical protein